MSNKRKAGKDAEEEDEEVNEEEEEQPEEEDYDDDDDGQEGGAEEDDPDVIDDDDAWLAPEDFKPTPKKDEDLKQAENFFTGSGSKQATSRLITDLNNFVKSDSAKYGLSAEPVGENLYLWDVKFFWL